MGLPMSTSTKQAAARTLLEWACVLWWLSGGALAADDRVDYLRSVKPIFSARCYACHGALKQKNGLRLDTAAPMVKGGDTGPAIVPGSGRQSPPRERSTAT